MAKSKRQTWLIFSQLDGGHVWRTVVGDCTREHAESVLEALMYDQGCPDDLLLAPIASLDNQEPLEKPVPYTPKENRVG